MGTVSIHQMPGKTHSQTWSLASAEGGAPFKGLSALKHAHSCVEVAEGDGEPLQALERGVRCRAQPCRLSGTFV